MYVFLFSRALIQKKEVSLSTGWEENKTKSGIFLVFFFSVGGAAGGETALAPAGDVRPGNFFCWLLGSGLALLGGQGAGTDTKVIALLRVLI